MSDEYLPPLRFFIHDIKPESTKLGCFIEIEVATRHYPGPPLKFRNRKVKYVGMVHEMAATFVDADLTTRVSLNGELISEDTEYEGDINSMDIARKAAIHYLEENLASELERITHDLCEEAYLHVSSPMEREKFIKQRVKRDTAAIRKRLPLPPNKMTQEEVGRFFNLALEAVEEMRKERLEFNRTNLAEKMFPRSSNPLQQLRRQVTRAGFHNPRRKGEFDDLLWILMDMYSKQVGKSLFRVEGKHELQWEESAFEQ